MQYNFYIDSIGTIGPGFSNWEAFCRQVNDDYFNSNTFKIPDVNNLPSLVQRRTTRTIQLALAIAEEVWHKVAKDYAPIASLFACSLGDTDIMDYLGETLATETRAISPAKFHNALHNAPSGYWGIMHNNQQPSIAISAGPNTFVVSLVEAATYCSLEEQPILLAAYDLDPPSTLKKYIPITQTFAGALILSPKATSHTVAKINLQITDKQPASKIPNQYLEKLSHENTIAKGLPLFYSLAKQSSANIILDYLPKKSLQLHCEFAND